jgi:stearoyl-CoA desaturase (Delta-9 desaturase)
VNVDFLYGFLNLSFWSYVVVTFLMVQFTFMGVTLYLHRDATHRSLDLHPVLRHVFRFWLWMSSGIVTKEWVAVHRKHHAIVLAVQLMANPVMAAGVINGIGHYYGYRNFECPDAARNIVPWGVLVAGEELHNNHHAFPSSAKFSIYRWEFDIGWLYIRVFQFFGLAKVIRVAPEPAHVEPRKHIDLETVRAVIVNRMHVLRAYTRHVTLPVFRDQLRIAGGTLSRRVRKLLVREPVLLDNTAQSRLREVLASNQALHTVHEFRERLRQMWSGANMSNEKLVQHLKEWIAQAEASRIKVLQDFAATLRGYAMQPA